MVLTHTGGARHPDRQRGGQSILTDADLTGAELTSAYLTDANLTEAKAWTIEQLTAAGSLKGATMPDGQTLKSDKMPHKPTFEEWLKDKEGGGKNRDTWVQKHPVAQAPLPCLADRGR